MAISLSSDLIADVMRSADPARLKAAAAKLHDLQSHDGGPRAFTELLEGLETPPQSDGVPSAPPGTLKTTSAAADAYVEFERMVLRNMFESLLPKADSGAFGSGPSASVWRSLAADQLAGLYASSGGIGIASALAPEEGRENTSQWPYFRTEEIKAFTG